MLHKPAIQIFGAVVLLSLTFNAEAGTVTDSVAPHFPPGIISSTLSSRSLAFDPQGNCYVIGTLPKTSISPAIFQDMNPGIGVDYRNFATQDAYVTRYNSDGSYAWTQTFGGNNIDVANAIAVSGDKVYVVGHFTGSASSSGGVPETANTPTSRAGYVLCLNAIDGKPASSFSLNGVQSFTGTGSNTATDVTVANNRVYVVGSFSASAQLPGQAQETSLGLGDVYVLCLDATTGEAITEFSGNGVQTMGSSQGESSAKILFFNNRIYLAGTFASSIAFAGLPAETSTGTSNTFIACISATNGDPDTAFSSNAIQSLSSASSSLNDMFATDGQLLATGSFSESIHFPGMTAETSAGDFDAYICKLNAATGAPTLAFGNNAIQRFGGTGPDTPQALTLFNNKLYITGLTYDTASIPGGTPLVSPFGGGSFLLHLNLDDGAEPAGFPPIQLAGVSSGGALTTQGPHLILAARTNGQDLQIGTSPLIPWNFNYDVILKLDSSGELSFPRITSSLNIYVKKGEPLNYTLTANQPILSSLASSVPAGLTFNNGILAGTITGSSNSYRVGFTATCPGGIAEAILAIVVNDAPDGVAQTFPTVIKGSFNATGGQGLALDATGNRFVTGSRSHLITADDWNAGVGVDPQRVPSDPYPFTFSGAFTTRYNADGTYAWTKTVGGSAYSRSVAVSGDRVYMVGHFEHRLITPDGVAVEAMGLSDAYVLCLNAADGSIDTSFGTNGVQTIKGADASTATAIAIANGKIYITGNAAGSTAVGTATSENFIEGDAYVACLDELTGQPITTFSDNGLLRFEATNRNADPTAIAVSNGKVYVTGICVGDISFPSGTAEINTNGSFIFCVNSETGAAETTFSSNGIQVLRSCNANGIVIHGGKLYIAGESSSIRLPQGTEFSPLGNRDAFVWCANATTGASDTSFNGSGLQRLGGVQVDAVANSVVSDGTFIYVAGKFTRTASISGGPQVTSVGGEDAFVFSVNASTGAANTTFRPSGIATFGGSQHDQARAVQVHNGTLLTLGENLSTNAGLGVPGNYSSVGDFFGFLLSLSAANGTFTEPRLTSPALAAAGVGLPFSYTISADEPLIASDAQSLPPGLTFSNGVISGIPTLAGNYHVPLRAQTASGFVDGSVRIGVVDDAVAFAWPPMIRGEAGPRVAVDEFGNRFVFTTFSNAGAWAADFNPGTGCDPRILDSRALFVTRFNADGSYAWTQTFACSTQTMYMQSFTLSDGRIFLSGEFTGEGSVDGRYIASSSIHGRHFALSISASNGHLDTEFGNGGIIHLKNLFSCAGMVVSHNRLYLTGHFSVSITAPGCTTEQARPPDGTDIFVMCVDATTGQGDPSFSGNGVQNIGGDKSDYGGAIAAEGDRLFVAGSTNSGVSIGSATAESGLSSFVAVLNRTTGEADTGFSLNGIEKINGTFDEQLAIQVGGGRVYLLGQTNGSINFSGALSEPRQGSIDVFVACMNSTTGQPDLAFSSNGIQSFGGANIDTLQDSVLDGSRLYITGNVFGSANIPGRPLKPATSDAFILCLNSTTGEPDSTFNSDGILYSGSGKNALAVSEDRLIWCYYTTRERGFELSGPSRQGNFYAALVSLDALTGAGVTRPTITSEKLLFGGQGNPFSYTLKGSEPIISSVATNTPPPGLVFNNGVLSGVPTTPGTFQFNVRVEFAAHTLELRLEMQVIGDSVTPHFPIVLATGSPSMAVDNTGNRFFAGSTSPLNDLNPQIGLDFPAVKGGSDASIARINVNGSYAWTRTFGSALDDSSLSVCVADQRVYIGFNYRDTVALPNGQILVHQGGQDTGVLCLEATTGNLIDTFGTNGAVTFSGPGNSLIYDIIVVDGTLYATGQFTESARLPAGPPVTSTGGLDWFIFSLDARTGSTRTGFASNGVQTFGGTTNDTAYKLAVSGSRLYACGEFTGSASVPGGTSVTSAGNTDAGILCLDAATGVPSTAFATAGVQRFGGTSWDYCYGMAISGNRLYVGGSFTSNASVPGGTAEVGVGSNDAYVLCLDANTGAAETNFSDNGVQAFRGSGTEEVRSIVCIENRVFAAGTFTAQASFPGMAAHTSLGFEDAFVLALDNMTGAPDTSIFQGGVFKFGGSSDEYGRKLVPSGSRLFLIGSLNSTNAGINGLGDISNLPSVGTTRFGTYALDVLNAPPIIAEGQYVTVNMDRNAVPTPFDLTLHASNSDNDPLSWTILSQPTSGLASVTGAGSATVSYVPALNFTGLDTFVVKVSDGFSSAFINVHVNVRATGNQAPGVIADINPAANAVPEASPSGTLTGLTVRSLDSDGTPVTYILSDNAGGRFSIDSSTGIVTVSNGSLLDFQAANTHAITVEASDGVLTASGTFTILVTFVNQFAPTVPVDIQPAANSVVENSPAGTAINLIANATDADGQPLSYSLTDNAGGRFSIDSGTGQVRVLNGALLDFEKFSSHTITVQASDGTLTSSATFTITVLNANEPPIITSTLVAVPNPVMVGRTTNFSVVASDPENDPSTVTYHFGDGLDGSTSDHAYALPGIYTAVATVSDGKLASQSTTLVVVFAASAPEADVDGDGLTNQFDTDDDGDGFSDVLESLAGTNSSDAGSAPVSSGSQPIPLMITKMSVSLNFSRFNQDSIKLAGILSLPQDVKLNGQKLLIDVGGVAGGFSLDEKGRALRSQNSFKLSVKIKKGKISAQNAKFAVTLAKGNFWALLRDEGFTDETLSNATRSILVMVVFNGEWLQKSQPQMYSAKQGRSGKSK